MESTFPFLLRNVFNSYFYLLPGFYDPRVIATPPLPIISSSFPSHSSLRSKLIYPPEWAKSHRSRPQSILQNRRTDHKPRHPHASQENSRQYPGRMALFVRRQLLQRCRIRTSRPLTNFFPYRSLLTHRSNPRSPISAKQADAFSSSPPAPQQAPTQPGDLTAPPKQRLTT